MHLKLLILFSGCSASQYAAVWRRSTFQGPMAGLKRDTSTGVQNTNLAVRRSWKVFN